MLDTKIYLSGFLLKHKLFLIREVKQSHIDVKNTLFQNISFTFDLHQEVFGLEILNFDVPEII